MSSLVLITGVVSLTLCCYATMTPDTGSEGTTTQLHVSAAPLPEIRCAGPPEKDNAFVLGNWNEDTYPHGHTVTYACRPGYVLGARMKMICFQGKWESLFNGYCKKRSCGHPGDIPFGKLELKNGDQFVFGAEVEYSCDEGYQMVSKQRTRVCAADGWTHEAPHCEARLCPLVGDDSVKVLTNVLDGEYSMGQVISFKCKDPNLQLKGPSSIYCTPDGTWNTDPPTCKSDVILKNITGSCTVQANDMRKNNIQLKNNKKLHYEDNEDVQFKCVSTYRISDPAKLKIKCTLGTLKYPTCNKTGNRFCGPPPQIIHGEMLSPMKNSYPPGSSVTYQCLYMYTLQPRPGIKCRGGTWDPPPVCLEPCATNEKEMIKNHIMLRSHQNKKNCNVIRDHLYREYVQKCYAQHNDIIRFACLPGYHIADPKQLQSKCNLGHLPYPTCVKRG